MCFWRKREAREIAQNHEEQIARCSGNDLIVEQHVASGRRDDLGKKVIIYLTENQAISMCQIKRLGARHWTVLCPMTRKLVQALSVAQHVVELGRFHVPRRVLVHRERLEVRFTASDLGGFMVAQIVGE